MSSRVYYWDMSWTASFEKGENSESCGSHVTVTERVVVKREGIKYCVRASCGHTPVLSRFLRSSWSHFVVGISILLLQMGNGGSERLCKMASIIAGKRWIQHSNFSLQSLSFLGEADPCIVWMGPEEPKLLRLDFWTDIPEILLGWRMVYQLVSKIPVFSVWL